MCRNYITQICWFRKLNLHKIGETFHRIILSSRSKYLHWIPSNILLYKHHFWTGFSCGEWMNGKSIHQLSYIFRCSKFKKLNFHKSLKSFIYCPNKSLLQNIFKIHYSYVVSQLLNCITKDGENNFTSEFKWLILWIS